MYTYIYIYIGFRFWVEGLRFKVGILCVCTWASNVLNMGTTLGPKYILHAYMAPLGFWLARTQVPSSCLQTGGFQPQRIYDPGTMRKGVRYS